MAFVRLAFFPGATAAHFEALATEMGEVEAPSDRLLFAAGPVDGGWQVVQLWRSREALEAFNASVFVPALRRVGAGVFPHPPVVTDLEPTVLEVR